MSACSPVRPNRRRSRAPQRLRDRRASATPRREARPRTTRVRDWNDGVYLSRDASLDRDDVLLGSVSHLDASRVSNTGFLAPTQGYQASTSVTLPDGINGTFYIIVCTDDDARGTSAGRVLEFRDEGNNLATVALPITLATPRSEPGPS